MDLREKIAKKIKLELVRQDKRAADLARLLNVSRSNVYHILQGKQALSLEQALKIVEFLGKDFDWLLDLKESETERRILNLAQNEREEMLIRTLLSAIREIKIKG